VINKNGSNYDRRNNHNCLRRSGTLCPAEFPLTYCQKETYHPGQTATAWTPSFRL